MKTRRFLLVGVIFLALAISILSFSYVSALMNYYNLNLTSTTIGANQPIAGTINLTLTNHDSGTNVIYYIDNVQKGSMPLLDFLNNANVVKSCNPSDCNKKYSLSDSGTASLENFNAKNNSYLGFYLQGTNVEIQELYFSVEGQSQIFESCGDSSFKIDILGDGVIDYEYSSPGTARCGYKYSSENFILNQANAYAIVENIPSCEKIYLPKTGSVFVSAIIDSTNFEKLVARIYDPLNTINELGNCTMYPDDDGNYSCIIGGEFSQSPSFFVKEAKEYLVCLQDTASTNSYKILTEQTAPFSGFIGMNNIQNPNKDFAIYVQPFSFSPFNDYFDFNSSKITNMKQSIQSYINTKYSGNCSQGCVIPMRFISNDENQKINISLIDFKARIDGSLFQMNKVYQISPSYPNVNISNQLINFAFLNITSPTSTGTHKIGIKIGDTLKEANFNVAQAPSIISLSPLQVIPNKPIMFFVNAQPSSANKPITSYKWNFGDGTYEQSTIEPFTTHTYLNPGTYNIVITVTDNTSISSSASFSVSTNLSFNYVNQSLNEKINSLNNFNSKLNLQDSWFRDLFGINVTQLNQSLMQYKQQLNTSATETQLLTIQQGIDSINVPENITETLKIYESIYYSSPSFIYPAKIEELAYGSSAQYDSSLEEHYKNSIALWEENNLDIKISGTVKALNYKTNVEDKLTLLIISLDPTGDNLDNIYFTVQLPAGVTYNNLIIRDRQSFDTKDLGDSIGFTFDSLTDKKYIYLAMPGSHDLTRIRMFASPDLNEFRTGTGPVEKEKTAPWVLVIFIILIILTGIGVALWFLWRDYDIKLEKKLFSNKNDLFTLMNYISSALKANAKDSDIKEKLEKAGWKSAQINYAIKKVKKQKKKERIKEKQQSSSQKQQTGKLDISALFQKKI